MALSIQEIAEDLISKGYAVFPIQMSIDTQTGEKTKPKYLCRWGTEAVNTILDDNFTTQQFGEEVLWSAFWANATHVGIACEPSGIVVFDYDVDIEFDDEGNWHGFSTHNLEREWGETANWILQATEGEDEAYADAVRLDTSSGGFHLYMRANPDYPMSNSAKRFSPHVDVRGNGGMVIAHNTNLPVVADLPMVTQPIWHLNQKPQTEGVSETPEGDAREPKFSEEEDGTRWGLVALDRELAILQTAWDLDNGTFNHTLNRVAFRVAQMVAGGELDSAYAYAVLEEFLSENGAPADQDRTLRSGWDSGYEHPRSNDNESVRVDLTEELKEFAKKVLNAQELREIPPPKWLFPGWLERNTLVHLVGAAGNGKSFVGLDWLACVASGRGWPSHDEGALTPGYALYVVAEGASGTVLRLDAWEKTYGPAGDLLKFLPWAIQVKSHEWDVFIEYCASLPIPPTIIMVDTQARVTVGVEENSNTEMGLVVNRCDMLKERTGATVVIVHHTSGEGNKTRGATSWIGAVDTEVFVQQHPKSKRITVECRKQKNAAADEGGKLTYMLDPVEGTKSVVLTPVAGNPVEEAKERIFTGAYKKAAKDILVAAEGPLQLGEIHTRSGLKDKSCMSKAIKALMDAGYVTKEGNPGQYLWTPPVEEDQEGDIPEE